MKDQIEEMARIIDDNHGFIVSSVETANALYNAGYRKQSEGAWIWKSNGYKNALHCSLCNKTAELHHKFCPNCGSKMKGE